MLAETLEEIGEIKRKYKMVNHQISQLKEEIESKEQELVKVHLEHKKKDKTIEEQQHIQKKYDLEVKDKEEKIKDLVNLKTNGSKKIFTSFTTLSRKVSNKD